MDSLKKTGGPEDVVHFVALPPVNTEDEISLIDLWLVLVRRKQVVLVGLLLGVTIASAFLLFVPEKYRFHTTIVLGQLTTSSADKITVLPIDTPETVMAKLEEGYIPQILEQAVTKSEDTKGYRLQVKIPKESNLVIVEADGPLQDENIYLQLINDAAQALVRDHDKIIAPVEARLSIRLERAKLELETIRDNQIFAVKINALKQKIANVSLKLLALKDQRKITEGLYKYTDIEDKLTKKQHQENEATLKTALENRAKSIKQNNNPATAVTLLIFGNEIQHYQNRIAELDQHMYITLPEKRENLLKQLEDNTRAQQQQTDLISSYQAELEKMHLDRAKQENIQLLAIKEIESGIAEIRPTQILRQAGRSNSPVGTGTVVKIALGVILGLMMGVFGAFLVEFLAKASSLTKKSAQLDSDDKC